MGHIQYVRWLWLAVVYPTLHTRHVLLLWLTSYQAWWSVNPEPTSDELSTCGKWGLSAILSCLSDAGVRHTPPQAVTESLVHQHLRAREPPCKTEMAGETLLVLRINMTDLPQFVPEKLLSEILEMMVQKIDYFVLHGFTGLWINRSLH